MTLNSEESLHYQLPDYRGWGGVTQQTSHWKRRWPPNLYLTHNYLCYRNHCTYPTQKQSVCSTCNASLSFVHVRVFYWWCSTSWVWNMQYRKKYQRCTDVQRCKEKKTNMRVSPPYRACLPQRENKKTKSPRTKTQKNSSLNNSYLQTCLLNSCLCPVKSFCYARR